MPRVPFVGRLYLYLPPFRPRTSEDFHTPEEIPDDFVFTTAGSSSKGGLPRAYDKDAERERLYYKIKAAEEREKAKKPQKRKWFKDEANAFLTSSLPYWRRNSQEYVALVVSFCFLIVESVLRVITLALRRLNFRVVSFCVLLTTLSHSCPNNTFLLPKIAKAIQRAVPCFPHYQIFDPEGKKYCCTSSGG